MTNMKRNTNKMIVAAQLAAMTAGFVSMGLSLSGCGTGLSGGDPSASSPVTAAHGTIKGQIHGGQQPIIGATIQLYTVGSTGLASASTPLISGSAQVVYNPAATPGTTGAMSDSNGYFSITGLYTCPATSQQVYLVASGGSAGSGSTSSQIRMMTPVGDCATLASGAATTFIAVNELTTVAAAYALSPFMTDYAHVGAATVNAPGLLNAIGNFNELVNFQNGTTPGPSVPAGAVIPTTEISTLADILAACINSTTNSVCTTLFAATGGATDTFGAAAYIAKNPSAPAVLALTSLASSTSPFQPIYAANPTDYTMSIRYTGGTLSAPYGIAIDGSGNAWVTSSTGSKVTEFSPNGTVGTVLTGGGLIGPKGISIDRSNNIWITNPSSNSIVEFNSAGTLLSGTTGFTVGGLAGPVAIANDSAGNAWVANLTGNSVTELSSTGAATQTSLTAGGTISLPTGIALDASGNVYIASNGSGSIVKLTNAGAVASGSPLTDVALQGASGVAIDGNSDVFASGSVTGATLSGATSEFSSAGAVSSVSPVTGGGLALPGGIATSGTTAFVTNGATAGSLSQTVFGSATPLSPTVGYGATNTTPAITGLNAPVGVAVDPSGSVWVANSGDNTLSVFIGLAAPVKTPLAANVGP